MWKVAICLFVIAAAVQTSFAAGKRAKCEITSGGKTAFKGSCLFTPEPGGSFSLSNTREEKPLLENITIVSVFVVQKGVAEVRGLTTDGITSRWGEAKRSQKDTACWEGSDFKICVR